ncbi:hypothetical protein KSC_007110 [Ktedonobacter sp. SOSP1-52]|uniref:FUSC family protein n=1 Tax=Ktedonobacter sp. SOSP1-52 TaxID=2778366 RepID=UPI001915CE19|nr:FUSC family protein [Ktedonobacter sp. SOSP1-52]GHO61819.1 hypothetical protein KSC_007110 [Ktedonobacter sp. SOSP1-52]
MRTLAWTLRHNLRWRKALAITLFGLKCALSAALAWQVAYLIAGKEAAALAAVSAVIVLQATSWQTIRKSIERVLGVFIGIALSVIIVHLLGLSALTILLTVFAAALSGLLFKQKGAYLATQIPISALLGLVVGVGEESYPALRLLGALIGGVIGTVLSLFLSPPIYAQKAQRTLVNLLEEVAQTLPTLADTVGGTVACSRQAAIYEHMHAVERKVRCSERELALGKENLRLNPWGRALQDVTESQPYLLEALEKVTRQMERIAWTVQETGQAWNELSSLHCWARRYAEILRIMGEMLEFVAERVYVITQQAQSQNATWEYPHHSEEEAFAQLAQTQERLKEEEDALLEEKEELLIPARNIPQATTRASYRAVVRSSLLMDLRRMLDELEDMLIAARQLQAG